MVSNTFSILAPRIIIREVYAQDDNYIVKASSCPQINFMYGNEFRNVDNVRRYIETLIKEYGEGKYRSFAIADRQTDKLIGMITLDVDKFFPRAELSYWIEKSYRNKGYATEAVNAIIEYGFLKRRLNRIQAMHFSDNPASGRVLEKSGMLFEGTLRQYVGKDDIFFDCQLYAILRSDYLQITEE